jgi:predicted permease
MRQVLSDQLAERTGPVRAFMVLLACADVLRVALVARFRQLRSRQRSGGRNRVNGFRQDLRFALRMLRRRPSFAGIAVLTLALGIGATTAVFSVVDAVLLRALPYEAADRIGILWHEMGDGAQNLPALHPLDFRDYRERSTIFEAGTMASGSEWILGGEDAPELVDVGRVEAGFFAFFGARPLLGRDIAGEDDQPGAAPVAVLSHRLWVRRYGSDVSVIGRSVSLNGAATEIIGVLPEGFRLHLPAEAFLLRDAELWVPARVNPAQLPPRNFTGFTGFVRLARGETFERAQVELTTLAAQLRAEHPVHASANLVARVEPLHADVVKDARDRLVLLLSAVGFVLLIACVNVANLMLARGRSRATEFSLRAALGAGRSRMARQILLESLVLAGAGGMAGCLLAFGGLALLVRFGSASIPLLDGAAVDPRVLGFAVLASVGSALLFGAIPAAQAMGQSPATALGSAGRTSGSRRQTHVRDALVIGEIAVSLVLLVGTGLMIRSFASLSSVDPGFATDDRVTFRVSLPTAGYSQRARRDAFLAELEDRLTGIAGVRSFAATSLLPLSGSGPLQPYAYDEETARRWESVTADRRGITPGYFATMGARLIAGRDFGPQDMVPGRRVIIVDDILAERAFPAQNPIGRRLQLEENGVPDSLRFAEVVGVVRHLRLHDLARPVHTQIYFPFSAFSFSVVLHVPNGGETVIARLRDEVQAIERGAIVEDVRTLSEITRASLAPARFALVLMLAFGALALVLASVGMYGVLAYTVSQRTREIGMRMALGELPGAIRWLVLRQGLRLVVIALGIGLAGAALTSRVAAHLLHGVDPIDPLTYGLTSITLTIVALAACWVPASRATRVDPMHALKAE